MIEPQSTAKTKIHSRRKRALHWIRRGHLYFGLFLFPWALLYGVTAFLFNHPTAFGDRPIQSFGPDALRGTDLDSVPSPTEQAEAVVARLNAMKKPAVPYRVAGEAKYNREFAFATVTVTEPGREQIVGILIDLKNRRGTVRSSPPPPKKNAELAPFAIGLGAPGPISEDLRVILPLPERVKLAIPAILQNTGFPSGAITVTSVPDLAFPLEVDGRIWTATYNATAGSLNGRLGEPESKPEPSTRGFLTRLHVTHGYPGEANAGWFWAILVDAMAFALCFWGCTGLVMWWQIKAARRAGAVVLILSATAAVALGWGMYALIAG